MSDENKEPQILNISGLLESIKVIKATVNRACKNGVFENIDEAYVTSVSLNNIETAVKTLDKHQRNLSKNKME